MHALVVYESMYGNTHAIAQAIAEGLRPAGDVRVVPVRDAGVELVAWADFVIVGGPTHAHGMTRSNSRRSAREAATKPDSPLTLEPEADGPGVRDWLDALGSGRDTRAAAFDTRVKGPPLITGRASSGIAKGLRGHGFRLVADAESYLVDTHNQLIPGEQERARRWGASLAELVTAG